MNKTNKNLKKASKKLKAKQEDKQSISNKKAAEIDFKLSELKHELGVNGQLLDETINSDTIPTILA